MLNEQLALLDDDEGHPAHRATRRGRIAADRQRWPALLRELCDVLAAGLQRGGILGPQQIALTYLLAESIGEHIGGEYVYLPRAVSLRRTLRDARMWDEFDGRNVRDLMAKYHLCEVQVYEILRRQRALVRTLRKHGG